MVHSQRLLLGKVPLNHILFFRMVTLEELKLVARAELLRCLDSLPGSKTLIWDPTLVAPFTLFAEPSLLQKHGVDKMVMLPEKGRLAQLPTQSGLDSTFAEFRPNMHQ